MGELAERCICGHPRSDHEDDCGACNDPFCDLGETECLEFRLAPVEPVPDPVNHPPHYTQGGIECIDAIKAALSPDEYQGFLKGQVLKYVWRNNHKGAKAEDLKKAAWYLQRAIEQLE